MPPISTESLPPMRTLNGEKYVDDPPPELACWLAIVYWNVVGRRNGRDRERPVVRADADAR